MDEKWSKDMKIGRKRLIAVKSYVAHLYIKRGDVKRAIANHETVKGIDRMLEKMSMKELSKQETDIQEKVVVMIQERPKTIDIATKKRAKKAVRVKEDTKRQRTMKEYGAKNCYSNDTT